MAKVIQEHSKQYGRYYLDVKAYDDGTFSARCGDRWEVPAATASTQQRAIKKVVDALDEFCGIDTDNPDDGFDAAGCYEPPIGDNPEATDRWTDTNDDGTGTARIVVEKVFDVTVVTSDGGFLATACGTSATEPTPTEAVKKLKDYLGDAIDNEMPMSAEK